MSCSYNTCCTINRRLVASIMDTARIHLKLPHFTIPVWCILMLLTVFLSRVFWNNNYVNNFYFICFKARHGWSREIPTKAGSHSGENVFLSVFTVALLLSTSVCLKPTWTFTSCQNNLTAPTLSCVTSAERSHLICTAWSERAKNIPQLAFWPIITDLWSERFGGMSGACLTSLECKNLPKHKWPTSPETAKAWSGPQHVCSLH